MSSNHRDNNGRFTPGNPGGPGRPRRAVEREYLAALSDAVPLETWKDIVQATVEAAKQGDAKARDWLARYLLGLKPASLAEVAAGDICTSAAESDILKEMIREFRDWARLEMFEAAELKKARRLLQEFEQLAETTSSPSQLAAPSSEG